MRVAVAPAKGPKRASPAKLTEGAVAGLNANGMLVVAGRRYRKIARKAGVSMRRPKAAAAAGAEYLVTLKVTRSRKKYFVTAKLLNTAGKVIKTQRAKYRRSKNARRTGVRLGRQLAEAIKVGPKKVASVRRTKKRRTDKAIRPTTEVRSSRDALSDSEASRSSSSGRPPARSDVRRRSRRKKTGAAALAQPDATMRSSALDARRTRSAATAGPGATAVATEPRTATSPEDSVFRIRVSAGSRLASSYDVTVDGQDTGLSYALSPIPLFEADVHFQLRKWGARLELGLAPVSYDINVDPEVEPSDPSGLFVGVGGHAFYEFTLGRIGRQGRLTLSPLLGAGYQALSVDAQVAAELSTPMTRSVVVSYTAIDVMVGARSRLLLSDRLAVEADVRAGFLVSYSESPVETGQDGGGFSIQAGAAGRYWLLSSLGIGVDVGYRFQQVGLSGAATRIGFEDDPELTDASISNGDLRLTAGVVVSL